MIHTSRGAAMTILKNSASKSCYLLKEHTLSRHFFKKSVVKTSVKLAYASYDSEKSLSLFHQVPILIMHGLFGSKTNWNSLAKAINQQTNRRVIAVDARNHGDSSHSSEMTYPAMSEDIRDLLKSLKVEKSILIGHSMGGAAMMCTALNYPDLVEKLLVVDMSPVKTSPSLHKMSGIIDTMLSIKFENSKTLSEARKRTDESLSKAIGSPSLRQFLLMNVIEVKPGEYKWRVNLPVIAENFANQIAVFPKIVPQLENKTFDGPTMFLAGSHSDYIKHVDHEAIKRLFTAAEFKYVNGAGHWVQSDKPAEFVTLASAFINK